MEGPEHRILEKCLRNTQSYLNRYEKLPQQMVQGDMESFTPVIAKAVAVGIGGGVLTWLGLHRTMRARWFIAAPISLVVSAFIGSRMAQAAGKDKMKEMVYDTTRASPGCDVMCAIVSDMKPCFDNPACRNLIDSHMSAVGGCAYLTELASVCERREPLESAGIWNKVIENTDEQNGGFPPSPRASSGSSWGWN